MINMMLHTGNQKGFTQNRLLISVIIIAILIIGAIAVLNPVGLVSKTRNSQRTKDVTILLTAIHKYKTDNKGMLPLGITSSEKQLGTCAAGGGTVCKGAADTCLDLSVTLAKYLTSIPTDPNGGIAATTKYSVVSDANNVITIKACATENSETIQVSK